MRLIDADALMEAINTYPKFGVDERGRIVLWNEGYEPYIRLMDVVIAITGTLTIEPERKTGTWQRKYSRPGVYADLCWHCSICGGKFLDTYANMWKYCPDCGAKMEGEQ